MSEEKDTRFETWHAHRVNLSGGQSLGGPKTKPGAGWTYGSGPGKGKTEGQLLSESTSLWNGMNESQRAAQHAAVVPVRNTVLTNPRTAPAGNTSTGDAADAQTAAGLGQSTAYVKMMRERAHPADGSPNSINTATGVRKPSVIKDETGDLSGRIASNLNRPTTKGVVDAPREIAGPPAPTTVTKPSPPEQMGTGPYVPSARSNVTGRPLTFLDTKASQFVPANGNSLDPAPKPDATAPAATAAVTKPDAPDDAVGNWWRNVNVDPSSRGPVAQKPADPIAATLDKTWNAGTIAADKVTARSGQGQGVMAPAIDTPSQNIAGTLNRAWKERGSQPAVTKPSLSEVAAAASKDDDDER